MSEPQIHFEVHGLKSGSWAVQRVCDEKATAVDVAKGLFKELDLKAIKVLKVTFDSSDPTFQDKEVYFEGERAPPPSSSSVELIEPICKKAEDMYLPEARRAIFKLLQKPLEGWQLTPLELLYHQGHVQKLNDTGQILQGAVQRAAISQVQKTGQNVNERVLDLYSITNAILQDLKTTTVEQAIPEIQGDDLLAALNEAKKSENWRKTFLMSLARYFQDVKTNNEKFEKITEFLNQYDDLEILEMLDRYLGDFMSSSPLVQSLLGEEENLGDALLSLIDFIRGRKKVSADMHNAARRIILLLGDKKLPETRNALTLRLVETLSGNKSFAKDNAFKSMLYHKRLLTRMHISDGEHIGGQDAVEALTERCGRMMGSTTIGEFLSGLEEPLDRVERLLEINEGVIGPVNKRTIANYILPVLDSLPNIKAITTANEPAFKVFTRLKKLQLTVRQSGFQDYFRDKILSSLDHIGMEILTRNNILGRLAKDSGDNIQLALNLLQIILQGNITEPKVMQTVREFAKKIIVSEEFMKALENKASGGGTPQTEFLKQFYVLLEKTGIR